jgi:hypothetical protein
VFSITAGMCITAKTDTITKAAKRDAKNFRLSDSLWKSNRRYHFPATSDYFKPAKTDVKDMALLNDSVYVHAFRQYAYKQNKHRRTTGHHILVGVEIAAGIAATALIAIIIFIAPNME